MIKEIFSVITPENIKTDPLYSQAITIFLGALEEHSKYSINIHDVFTSDDKEIRIQFIKTFYNAFYEIMKGLSDGFHDMVLPDIETVLTNEYLYMSRFFKESKGTPASIKYIYSLIERLLAAYLDADRAPFKFTDEGVPFYFSVEGALSREFYDLLVRPLAHPLGFAYVYTCVKKFSLHDMFNIGWKYDVQNLEVRCSQTSSSEIFAPSSVTDILDDEIGVTATPTRIFYLDNGTYLKQTSFPSIKVSLYYAHNNSLIFNYPDGCVIYALYSKYIELSTLDPMFFDLDINNGDEIFGRFGVDCTLVGAKNINTFNICSGVNRIAEEYYETTIDIDFRKNWNYFKRFTEPLLEGTVQTSPEIWDEVYGKVCFESQNFRKTSNLIISDIDVCSAIPLIGTVLVGDFSIGSTPSQVLDYNHLWEHIRGSIEGDIPLIGQESTIAHLVIGGFDALTELPPVFEDRVVRKIPEYTTDLFDIQEFTTEKLEISREHEFKENFEVPTEESFYDVSAGFTDIFYSDSDEPAVIGNTQQLLIGDFLIGGLNVKSIIETFTIEII